jgi:hypothetical protein
MTAFGEKPTIYSPESQLIKPIQVCRFRRKARTRGSRFLIFNFLQFAIDGKNNSKTQVEKVVFFIFMSSYAEMSF